MITLQDVGDTQLATGLFIDPAERFALKTRNGVATPTVEPVSDTALTPFGLTLRTTPTRRKTVRVRSVDGVITMGTDQVTTYESDGDEEASDTQTDYNTD